MAEEKIFGKYELLKKIGGGSIGEVFLAKHIGLGREMVIKKIYEKFSKDEKFFPVFRNEAIKAIKLDHRNIVNIYELGKVDSSFYIAMEYIKGKSLRDIIEQNKKLKKRIPLRLGISIISKVCEALDFAHHKKDEEDRDLNIVHLGISPSGILISSKGSVKVSDFGVARVVSQVSGEPPEERIRYMSPEQLKGEKIDKRTDLFSLGVVMYEIFSGKNPFVEGEALKENILQGKVKNPRSLNSQISKELEEIILKSLLKAPAQRYQEAKDLLEELHTIMVYSILTEKGKPERRTSDLEEYLQNLFPEGVEPELVEVTEITPEPKEEEIAVKPAEEIKIPEEEATKVYYKTEELETGAPSTEVIYESEKLRQEETKGVTLAEETARAEEETGEEGLEGETMTITLADLEKIREKELKERKKKARIWPLIALGECALILGLLFVNLIPPKAGPAVKVEIQSFPSEADLLLELFHKGSTRPYSRSVTPFQKNIGTGKYILHLKKKGFKDLEKELVVNERIKGPLQFILQQELNLNSRPQGASLAIKGEDLEIKGKTPFSRELEAGKYKISIAKEGYEKYEKEVDLSKPGTGRVQANLRKMLKIASAPLGARIFINDEEKSRGDTSNGTITLSSGTHILRLKKEGFDDFVKTINIDTNTPPQFYFELKKSVYFHSLPSGADVYLDGKRIGKTPLTYKVSPGTHKIKFKKAGYYPSPQKSRNFQGTDRFMLSLLPLPALLNVKAYSSDLDESIEGAKVFLSLEGGEEGFIGTTPLKNYKVEFSRYSSDFEESKPYLIRISQEEYEDYLKKGTLKADRTESIKVNLKPVKGVVLIKAVPGASLYLDGKKRGTGEVFLEEVPLGEHIARIEYPPLEDKVVEFRVEKGALETTPLESIGTYLTLLERDLLLIKAVPGASLYLDREKRGEGQVLIRDISRGKHILRIEYPVPEEKIINFKITKEQKTFTFILTDNKVQVR